MQIDSLVKVLYCDISYDDNEAAINEEEPDMNEKRCKQCDLSQKPLEQIATDTVEVDAIVNFILDSPL